MPAETNQLVGQSEGVWLCSYTTHLKQSGFSSQALSTVLNGFPLTWISVGCREKCNSSGVISSFGKFERPNERVSLSISQVAEIEVFLATSRYSLLAHRGRAL
jgi:hypothetical protein